MPRPLVLRAVGVEVVVALTGRGAARLRRPGADDGLDPPLQRRRAGVVTHGPKGLAEREDGVALRRAVGSGVPIGDGQRALVEGLLGREVVLEPCEAEQELHEGRA